MPIAIGQHSIEGKSIELKFIMRMIHKFTFKTSLAIILWTMIAWIGRAQEADVVKVGDKLPAFQVVADDGSNLLSTEQLKGKVVLINFFATWCPPCQKELAAVQQTLWPKYKDRAKFALLVIGREHNEAELAKYNEKKGFTFPLYPDKNRSIYASFAHSLIPRSYLVDQEGKIIHATQGYTEEEFTDLMKRIEEALR